MKNSMFNNMDNTTQTTKKQVNDISCYPVKYWANLLLMLSYSLTHLIEKANGIKYLHASPGRHTDERIGIFTGILKGRRLLLLRPGLESTGPLQKVAAL
jgi:hypothetical protein